MESLETRFWNKVDKTNPDGCWEWKGSRNKWNYGKITVEGKSIGTHVIAWKLINGDFPKELEVLHHCDNPPCCRPDHYTIST